MKVTTISCVFNLVLETVVIHQSAPVISVNDEVS